MGKIKWYGSLNNRIAENMEMPAPKIGMGVTQLLYSDRHPFEVIEILNGGHDKFCHNTPGRIGTVTAYLLRMRVSDSPSYPASLHRSPETGKKSGKSLVRLPSCAYTVRPAVRGETA